MSKQRVQKIIAQSGYTSRRKAEILIENGRVKINGKTAMLGDRVGPDDQIDVDGKALFIKTPSLDVIMLNKPAGYISSKDDPQKRKSVFQLLPPVEAGARWINIGRLDINTTGLLLFTTDGDFAHFLMHPSSNIEREYLCRVYGDINDSKINRLKDGIKLKPENVVGRFKSITAVDKMGKNQWYKVVLSQGRYREVRRLWQAVNCQVNRLSRIRFGHLELPQQLPQGEWVLLNEDEIARFNYRNP